MHYLIHKMKKKEISYAPLYRYELYCYIIIWASGIIYAIYNLIYISSSKYIRYCLFWKLLFCLILFFLLDLNTSDIPDLVPGWSWLGRKKDTCPEWRIWTTFIIYSLSPWIILHSSILLLIEYYFMKVCILSIIYKVFLVNYLVLISIFNFGFVKVSTLCNVWFISVTSLCIAYNFGLISVFIFFGLTLIYYCLLLLGNQLFIWIMSICLLWIWSYNDSLFVRELQIILLLYTIY